MKVSNFSFKLPQSLIAQYPCRKRSSCRLMLLNGLTGNFHHDIFSNLTNHINPGDLLVLNNTRVIPARLYGFKKASGGKVELLIERIIDDNRVLSQIKSSKNLNPGDVLLFGENKSLKATLLAYSNNLFEVYFSSNQSVLEILNNIGHMPLPPYIKRFDENIDWDLYQTVYSQYPGSVASPTAGLHFDNLLLDNLSKKGVKIAFITLHIGVGTFQPVRVETVEQHVMHSEYIEVSKKTVNEVIACRNRRNRVIAIGTTSARSLEMAAQSAKHNIIEPFSGETNLFIYPGYQYQITDALITNFHLPNSTLIMLVSAFAGWRNTLNAYQAAVKEQYQFFSYGDAMFITYNPQSFHNVPD